MVVVTFSSSLSINSLPVSTRVRPPRTTPFVVSCRATKQHDMYNNLYKILSLSPKSATTEDIKKAYRSMALRYHPDACHDGSKKEERTRMFVQLNEAYKTLSNPRLRAEYDCELLGLSLRSDDRESWRCVWQAQLAELKRRSHRRRRMAPQNIL